MLITVLGAITLVIGAAAFIKGNSDTLLIKNRTSATFIIIGSLLILMYGS